MEAKHLPLVPLTRADLERIAEERGIRIDDLWPEIEARAVAQQAHQDEPTA